MKWTEIPGLYKAVSGIVVGIMAVMGYLTTYQTDAEAQAYQQQHGQELQRVRIQMIESQIAQYRYQLLSLDLTAAQREWILAEIKRLEAQIQCIRAGSC